MSQPYVCTTHVHEDSVSGAVSLVMRSGGTNLPVGDNALWWTEEGSLTGTGFSAVVAAGYTVGLKAERSGNVLITVHAESTGGSTSGYQELRVLALPQNATPAQNYSSRGACESAGRMMQRSRCYSSEAQVASAVVSVLRAVSAGEQIVAYLTQNTNRTQSAGEFGVMWV